MLAAVLAAAACERRAREPGALPGPQSPAPPPVVPSPPRAPLPDMETPGTMGPARPEAVRVHRAEGPAPHSDAPWITFTDVTAGSGLEGFVLHAGEEHPKNWIVESTGGGICAADYDGDGDIDLVLVDGAGMTIAGDIVPIEGAGTRMYRNDGGFRFTDVTASSGIPPGGYLLGGAAADYDGDGHTDLLLVGFDCRRLLRNRGDGTFEDVTAAAHVAPSRWEVSCGCAWADVDGDGLLDVIVGDYTDQRHVVDFIRMAHPGEPRSCVWFGVQVMCGPKGIRALPNRLFLQRRDHTFTDASDHLPEAARATFQPVFSDLDGDGDLDCYVPNDAEPNEVLENDGKGWFTDRGTESGAATSIDFDAQASMGVAVADFDRDGRMDVAVTNFAKEYNALYRNRTRPGGTVLFDDVATRTRFSNSPQARVCWGVGLLDLDQDDVLDAFVAAGHVYTDPAVAAASDTVIRQTCLVLRGLGPPKFEWEDVSDRSGPPLADARLWRGAVFPDLDGDGDPDVVLTAQHAGPAVLRNDGGERNAWVRFDLRPRKGLPTPAGARVTITLPDGGTRVAELHCGSSNASSDDPRIHFGLGKVGTLPRVDVRWPGGATTTLRDVGTRRVVVVRQDE